MLMFKWTNILYCWLTIVLVRNWRLHFIFHFYTVKTSYFRNKYSLSLSLPPPSHSVFFVSFSFSHLKIVLSAFYWYIVCNDIHCLLSLKSYCSVSNLFKIISQLCLFIFIRIYLSNVLLQSYLGSSIYLNWHVSFDRYDQQKCILKFNLQKYNVHYW